MPQGAIYLQNNLIPKKVVNVILSEDNIRAMRVTPIVLVDGKAGVFYIPEFILFKREAGTAYTLNGSTLIRAIYGTNPALGFLLAIDITTFIGSVNEALAVTYGLGALSGTSASMNPDYLITILGASGVGQPLSLSNNTASFTGGTGRLGIIMTYYEIPFSNSFFGM